MKDCDRMSRRSVRQKARKQKLETTEEPAFVLCTRKRKASPENMGNQDVAKRRQQFQIQNRWVPISQGSHVGTSFIVATDSEELNADFEVGSHFQIRNLLSDSRLSPLPDLNWASSRELWSPMLEKEALYNRDHNYLNRHPGLAPRMRAILLDWLIEVCEVYRLHRETFYLAQDFIDRFLSTERDLPKHRLQHIGITALFIAAKLEEIYPPKVTEFAYVTDGACTDEEILDMELVLLKALNWELSPMTVNSWLNVYLQLANLDAIDFEEFYLPQYSGHTFVQVAQLVDLCMLDISSLQFSYAAIATAALYHNSCRDICLRVSGFSWEEVAPCVQWMTPYAITRREAGYVPLKMYNQISPEAAHNIQNHTCDLAMLEKAQARQAEMSSLSRASPLSIPGMITPPQSNKKQHTTT
ncbi:G1/S-specific cyclin-E-like isoform X1 [Branchiostoma floridae]|uniref:G1/S-specific cyclin-E-like isoform X1 n=1 Tax=Branchiostoma floridae TaxID=7739 RepID=C3ZBU1_BRAFL|nr:G1/S-specific cyclin-E-like isoform X1 [Branchiostoma floridae]|eukprot:XP_002594317.1 hypothetical protein BRAFLDRAFT_260241 [Branchiostoma floridae]